MQLLSTPFLDNLSMSVSARHLPVFYCMLLVLCCCGSKQNASQNPTPAESILSQQRQKEGHLTLTGSLSMQHAAV